MTKVFLGIVEATMRENKPQIFTIPAEYSVVMVAKITRVMLDDRIVEMIIAIKGDIEINADLVGWQLPKLTGINRVLVCGKTTHIVGNFDKNVGIVATTTVKPAKDIKEKMARCMGEKSRSKMTHTTITLHLAKWVF
ncbi:unnamed protein product [Euphydryas editha]|uniref:Uncharacterized protein n=1 Tax=Euphydryas editha TaxID=104508 RepID=A0AAU9V1M7_EUPED|nr:unnamed protein product [Euphydryas editha]